MRNAPLALVVVTGFSLFGASPAHAFKRFEKLETIGDFFMARSEAPKKASEVTDAGAKRVLLFRDDLHGDVQKEIDLLAATTDHPETMTIPFPYHGFESARSACEMSITALNVLVDSRARGIPTIFHCNAGIDRTGYLAGLYRVYVQGWDVDRTYRDEMCAKSYGDGGFRFGPFLKDIRAELTPVFFHIATELAVIHRDGPVIAPVPSDFCERLLAAKPLELPSTAGRSCRSK